MSQNVALLTLSVRPSVRRCVALVAAIVISAAMIAVPPASAAPNFGALLTSCAFTPTAGDSAPVEGGGLLVSVTGTGTPDTNGNLHYWEVNDNYPFSGNYVGDNFSPYPDNWSYGNLGGLTEDTVWTRSIYELVDTGGGVPGPGALLCELKVTFLASGGTDTLTAGSGVVFFDQGGYDALDACAAGAGDVFTLTVDGDETEIAGLDFSDEPAGEDPLSYAEGQWLMLTDGEGQEISEFGDTFPSEITGALFFYWIPPDMTVDPGGLAVVLTCVNAGTTLTYTFSYLGTSAADPSTPTERLGWWYAIVTAPASPHDGTLTTGTVSGAPVPTSIPAGEGSSSGWLPLAGVMMAFAGGMVARRGRAGAAA
jgi:hypothetical protein